jgi:hypothetical protein
MSAEDMPSISDYPYSSSSKTNMGQSISTGESLAVGNQGYNSSTATNTPTTESNDEDDVAGQKPASSSSGRTTPVTASSTRKEEDTGSSDDSSSINDDEPRMSGKRKPIPKSPKCEFFSFFFRMKMMKRSHHSISWVIIMLEISNPFKMTEISNFLIDLTIKFYQH